MDLWFDTVMVPILERWRSRSIRSHGLLEEAFGQQILPVGSQTLDVIAQTLEEDPSRAPEKTWYNSSLGHLFLSRFPTADGNKKEDFFISQTDAPTVFVSETRLAIGDAPCHGVLKIRPANEKANEEHASWQRVDVHLELGLGAFGVAISRIANEPQYKERKDLELEVHVPMLSLAACEAAGGPTPPVIVLGAQISGRATRSAAQNTRTRMPVLPLMTSRMVIDEDSEEEFTPKKERYGQRERYDLGSLLSAFDAHADSFQLWL